jgi:hypothetical protein
VVCSARASRLVILVRQTGCANALAGISQSGQRSCSCQRSSLDSRVRMSRSRSRYMASCRISRSGPANRAVGRFSTPSRNAARAIASASIGSDLPRVRAPRRAPAINCGARRTTVSPRSIKNRSSEPETLRTSSIAHTRSGSPARGPTPIAGRSRPAAPARSGAHLNPERVDRRGGVGLLVRINSDRRHLLLSLHSLDR